MKILVRRPVMSFFVLAFGISWFVWIAGFVKLGVGVSAAAAMPYIYAGSFGPMLAAVIMLAVAAEPRSRWKAWLAGFVRVRVHPVVYFLVLFGLPVSFALLHLVLGIRPDPGLPQGLVYVTMILMAPLNAFVGSVVLGAGPLGEEPGWRGFALPRMLAFMGDWAASLVLGCLWALWHLPIIIGVPEWRAGVPTHLFLPTYVIGVVALAYLLTKLWQWSRGSLFIAIWFHGMVNFSANYAVDRQIWSLDAYSDLQLHLLSTGGILAFAAFVALLAWLPVPGMQWRYSPEA